MNALTIADPQRATALMTAQKFQQDQADKATRKTAAAGIVDDQGGVNLAGVGGYIRATGDVEGGLKLHEFAQKASDQQKKQWADSASHLASFGMTIKGQTSDPAARKAAALADPTLSHFGITPEMINSTDFSDQGLDKFVAGQSAIKDTLTRQDGDAKEARNAATDTETLRHHRALEAAALGGLKVRQGALGLANQRYQLKANAPGSAPVAPLSGVSDDELLSLATEH
jgi:hypothetical protein